MTRSRFAWWGLTLLTVLVYAALVSLGQMHLDVGDGQQPFDLRVMGYSADEAQAYLDALHPVQVTLYRGILRLLDTIFPVMFGVWLYVSARALKVRQRPLIWMGPAYALVDLIENALVSRLLAGHGGVVSTDLVAWASVATQAKFTLLAITLILLGRAGIVRWRAL
ncbi:MAG: hypothetical protein ACRBBS_07410 [Thalassovita sp.]